MIRQDVFSLIDFRKKTVEKIRPLVKDGFLPTRGPLTPYTQFKSGVCNCFVHALGFSNQQLAQIGFNISDGFVFGGEIFEPELAGCKDPKIQKQAFFDLLGDFGLKVDCDRQGTLKNNEWRVALYFDKNWPKSHEFHWVRERKDGFWEAKTGFTQNLEEYKSVPDTIKGDFCFKLESTHILSNPNVKER